MEQTELERVAEAILFAAGEPVELERIAIAAECDPDEAEQAVRSLMDRLSYERRGIRILRLEHAYQMCSSGEMSSYVTRALETRKPPRLSSAQLETLTVIAYYQPQRGPTSSRSAASTVPIPSARCSISTSLRSAAG